MSAESRRAFRPLPLAAGALLAVSSARAQEVRGPGAAPDSLPARAGTYALEGGLGVYSSSVGALRFVAPRSALGLTVAANYLHTRGGQNATRDGSVSASLGFRHYGRLRDRITAFGTLGVTGGYTIYEQSTNYGQGQSLSRQTYASAGGFGEVGASYLVARRLTVNGSILGSVVGLFDRNHLSTAGTTNAVRQDGFSASLGPVRFGLTLFL